MGGDDGDRVGWRSEQHHPGWPSGGYDPGAGGFAGKKDRGDRQGDCGSGKREICAHCGPFLVGEDHLFPQTLHPASHLRADPPSHRP